MKRETGLWICAAIYALSALSAKREWCLPAYRQYGLEMHGCPDGKLRQTAHLEVTNVRRGAPGLVRLTALAHYTRHDADRVETAPLPVKSVAFTLVDSHHAAKPLAVEWSGDAAKVTLPDRPDG